MDFFCLLNRTACVEEDFLGGMDLEAEGTGFLFVVEEGRPGFGKELCILE